MCQRKDHLHRRSNRIVLHPKIRNRLRLIRLVRARLQRHHVVRLPPAPALELPVEVRLRLCTQPRHSIGTSAGCGGAAQQSSARALASTTAQHGGREYGGRCGPAGPALARPAPVRPSDSRPPPPPSAGAIATQGSLTHPSNPAPPPLHRAAPPGAAEQRRRPRPPRPLRPPTRPRLARAAPRPTAARVEAAAGRSGRSCLPGGHDPTATACAESSGPGWCGRRSGCGGPGTVQSQPVGTYRSKPSPLSLCHGHLSRRAACRLGLQSHR